MSCDMGLYNHLERMMRAQAGPPGLGVGAGVTDGEGHGQVHSSACAVKAVKTKRGSSFFTVYALILCSRV